MGSLVFTAFTLEAYLNWIGDKLFPHWKYLERLNPKEKLAVISDQLGVKVEFGERPWQVMKDLFNFRNEIAHGKPENLISEAEEQVDEGFDERLGQAVQTKWEKFCTGSNAKRAREDVTQILETLHAAANLDNSGPFFRGLGTHHASL